MRDPYPQGDEEPGPLLSLILDASKAGRPYDEAWLLCTGGTFLERARDLEREVAEEGVALRVIPLDFPLRDVIDYAEIWQALNEALKAIRARAGAGPHDWTFLLDSGTPQMKTALFLAARSGLFPARLIQGIPPRFAGGAYKQREVCVEGLPSVCLGPGGPGAEAELSPGYALRLESERGDRFAPMRPAAPQAGKGPVARSTAFDQVLGRAAAAARYDDPVLILGETGTGKTMVARRIHEQSARRSGPFVEVNCSAIPEALAESELFGHARGSFSGADKARAGKFRAAHGGTLFLDEIGDLAPELQAKLLKAIEDKTVTPVGSDEPAKADARLVAATNRNLDDLVKAGRFRRDLYERLKVVVLRLPPLRERREDIGPLVARFLALWNEQYGEARYLTPDAMVALESYPWPGNVRELQNALRSAACSSASCAIGPESLPEELLRARDGAAAPGPDPVALPDEGVNLKARLLQIEWEYVAAALRKSGGNRESAAKLLGLTGHAFRKALRERLSAFADEGWEDGI
jgi:DNA-binding NtrC family response regulator